MPSYRCPSCGVLHSSNVQSPDQFMLCPVCRGWHVLRAGTRDDLIAWLVATDPNGIWTDEDAAAEGREPLTLLKARIAMHTMLARDGNRAAEP